MYILYTCIIIFYLISEKVLNNFNFLKIYFIEIINFKKKHLIYDKIDNF